MGSTREGSSEYDPILERVLAGIPTAFGRLAWIASLRVQGLGGSKAASAVLRRLHSRLFIDWLALSLEEKCKDFTEYSESVPASREKWSLKTSEKLIPSDARKAERYLFETDIAVVLELVEA